MPENEDDKNGRIHQSSHIGTHLRLLGFSEVENLRDTCARKASGPWVYTRKIPAR